MRRKGVRSGKFHYTSIYACARVGFPPKFSELSNRSDNGMHRQEPPGVTQSSSLVWWRVSPPVTRDTGRQCLTFCIASVLVRAEERPRGELSALAGNRTA